MEQNRDYLEINTEKERRGRSFIIQILVFSIFPILAFYLMEAYEHNPFATVRAEAQLFNILLFELIAWIFYLVFGGMRLAIRLELVVAMVFGLVNHYVMLFRSTPFVPWDIFSVGTAVSVVDTYDFTPGARVFWVSLGFIMLMALAEVLKKSLRLRPRFRLPAAVLVTLVLCVFTNALQDEKFQLRHYLYPYLFTPVYMTEVNGMAVTFAMNLQYLQVERPKEYDRQEASDLLASYDKKSETGEAEEYPNIIVIMDEAFSDLAVLGELETNEDYMPFYHKMQQGAENTVTGYAQVSVCGGNTANSEFEFLTGNTMAFLPSGSIPYQQYIKRELPSLASELSALGYQTYAQHPYYGSGWNRESVYALLGFDTMDFIEDYGYKNYLRKYVSDACDFGHVISTFEEKEAGKPAFIFNVTMQNHGGYTDTYANFSSNVEMKGGSNALNQYLSLVQRTDRDLENLIDYFSGVEEKTIIVFFGDHQPSDSVVAPVWTSNGVDPTALTEEEQKARYQVPYLIWANYDIEEGREQNTSLNYLGAKVLELAEVPTDAYQNYLLELKQSYPVISAAGTTTSKAADSADLEEMLQTYRKLQYYRLFDEGE